MFINPLRAILSLLVGLLVVGSAYFAGGHYRTQDLRAQGKAQEAMIAQATKETEEKFSEQIRVLKQANDRSRQVVRAGTFTRDVRNCPVLTSDAARVLNTSTGDSQSTERIVEIAAPVGAGSEATYVIDPEAVERNREAFEVMRAQLLALQEWVRKITQ